MSRPAGTLGLAAVATLSLLAACADLPSDVASADASRNLTLGSTSTLSPGRYLVGVTPNEGISAALLAAGGATLIDSVPKLGIYEVQASNPSALRAPGVRYVEPSFEVTLDVQRNEVLPPQNTIMDQPQVGTNPSSAPLFSNKVQWDMVAMKADWAWQNSEGGRGALVCIIDSGLDSTHVELRNGKVIDMQSFVPNTNPLTVSEAQLDSNGHGTHVGSTVTGNGVNMASVAPDARLLGAKVFAATGGTPVPRVVQGLQWCTDKGAHVINMSLGGIRYYPPSPVSSEPSYAAYADGVQYAYSRGVVVVVSAGNNNLRLPNTSQLVLPANVPGTLIVGATGPLSRSGTWVVNGAPQVLPLAAPSWDPFNPQQVWLGVDGKAFYSNFGTSVHVFAPGGRGSVPLGYVNRIVWDQSTPAVRVQQVGGPHDNIWAACANVSSFTGSIISGGAPGASATCRSTPTVTRYASLAGTSMAAPHVAGLAALLYGELGGARSVANRTRVENCIKSTTDNIGPATTFGGGRVNAQRALTCIRG